MSLQVNENIGEYMVLEKLGEGAFGEVWKAEQEITRKTVALKVLKSEADISSFIRESEVIHHMKHGHIVGIVGGNLRHERPHIAMELVEGGSLGQILEEKVKLPPKDALEILRDVADAIAYAHKEGFLHRDLKPGNILIADDGRAKVCDFG
ncbi:MAG: serine/threonine protein kinase, partial [Planctomycetota bacterium]